KPTEHIVALQNVLRADDVKPSLSTEKALANAPEAESGCFKVPRVLE
ncbi:MAG: Asp-tRNA(Asn)/Glu-tRNA(Gln) amidotransferase subunit GatC, partial [Eubacterium sp.]